MLMLVAAVLELIAWIFYIAGFHHSHVLSWESFMLAGFFFAFLDLALGWRPLRRRTVVNG